MSVPKIEAFDLLPTERLVRLTLVIQAVASKESGLPDREVRSDHTWSRYAVLEYYRSCPDAVLRPGPGYSIALVYPFCQIWIYEDQSARRA